MKDTVVFKCSSEIIRSLICERYLRVVDRESLKDFYNLIYMAFNEDFVSVEDYHYLHCAAYYRYEGSIYDSI